MVNRAFFLCFLLAYPLFGAPIEENIKKIPLHDRICMRVFFDQAIRNDQAAHVLYFKNKPTCLTGPALKHRDKTFKDILALRGWQAFKKNESLFPHPHFLFSEEVTEFGPNCKTLNVYIINRESLTNCLSDHLELFKKTLGPEFSSEQLITKLQEGASLPSLLQKDEMLLGLLLGYGHSASKTFKELHIRYQKKFAPQASKVYCRLELKQPKGCKLCPVVFMGNPEAEEVKKLVETYEKELAEIWATYRASKDPLKDILERLCSE